MDFRKGRTADLMPSSASLGLFGMLQVCLGQREPVETDDREIREIQEWIPGLEPRLLQRRISTSFNDFGPEIVLR